MASLQVDPEFAEIWAPFASFVPPIFSDPLAIRENVESTMAQQLKARPYPEGMEESQHMITSLDGAATAVVRFVPAGVAAAPLQEEHKRERGSGQRAVVYVFGGGLVAGSVDLWRPLIANFAHAMATQVFATDYRRAPEHPYPAAVGDVYSTVRWLHENAVEFEVDPTRIVLFGISAGGAVAAGAALMARDRGLAPPLAAQALRYPMLDDRSVLAEGDPLRRHLTWTSESNAVAWGAYLGKERAERTDETVPDYAAPARAKNLRGLPLTFIDVGSLDLFKGESVAYAAGLAKADVGVEFHMYQGVPHGFEGIAPGISVSKEMEANLEKFVTKF